MKYFKNAFIASSISITICTTISVVLYSIFGRGSFQFITPYTIQTSAPVYNAYIALMIYATAGVFFYTCGYIIEHEKFGFNKITVSHFVVSWIILSILGVLTSYPVGIPISGLYDYYFGAGFTISFITYPIFSTLIAYVLIYILLIIYYKFQISKLNNKIHSNQK